MTRKKGTLRTKGGETEIQGTFNYAEDGAISFTAEGSRLASFFTASEWEFAPEVKPLPTEDGVVILNPAFFPVIRSYGKWHQFQFNGDNRVVDEEAALDRLRNEGARIFDAKSNELNREEYV